MLVAGSPLQIYHPDNGCQYMLVGVFAEISNGHYHFIDIANEHYSQWIGSLILNNF